MDKRPSWLLRTQAPGGGEEAEVVPFDEDEDGDGDTWTDGRVRWAIERIRTKARQRARADGTPRPEPAGTPVGRLAFRLKRR